MIAKIALTAFDPLLLLVAFTEIKILVNSKKNETDKCSKWEIVQMVVTMLSFMDFIILIGFIFIYPIFNSSFKKIFVSYIFIIK